MLDKELWKEKFEAALKKDFTVSRALERLTKDFGCDEEEVRALLHHIANDEEEVYKTMEFISVRRQIELHGIREAFCGFAHRFPDLKEKVAAEDRAKLVAWENATLEISEMLRGYEKSEQSSLLFMRFGVPLLVGYVLKKSNGKYAYEDVATLVRSAKLDRNHGYTGDAVRKTVDKFKRHAVYCWDAITRVVDRCSSKTPPDLVQAYFAELESSDVMLPVQKQRLNLQDASAVKRYLRRHGIKGQESSGETVESGHPPE